VVPGGGGEPPRYQVPADFESDAYFSMLLYLYLATVRSVQVNVKVWKGFPKPLLAAPDNTEILPGGTHIFDLVIPFVARRTHRERETE